MLSPNSMKFSNSLAKRLVTYRQRMIYFLLFFVVFPLFAYRNTKIGCHLDIHKIFMLLYRMCISIVLKDVYRTRNQFLCWYHKHHFLRIENLNCCQVNQTDNQACLSLHFFLNYLSALCIAFPFRRYLYNHYMHHEYIKCNKYER